MGCRLSSHVKFETVEEVDAVHKADGTDQQDNAGGAQQNQINSVGQHDTREYIDNVDISDVNLIFFGIHGCSTLLELLFLVGEKVKLELFLEVEPAMETILLCLKKKRQILIKVHFYNVCVWPRPVLDTIANFFLRNVPKIFEIDFEIDFEHGNRYVPFIDFYQKLYPIVEVLLVDDPAFLRHFLNVKIKKLGLNSSSDCFLFPLKYAQVQHIKLCSTWLLKSFHHNGIVMPSVITVIVYLDHQFQDANLTIFENVGSSFPGIKTLTLFLWRGVSEDKSIPLMDHSLFAAIDDAFQLFESMLKWKQEQFSILIDFKVGYSYQIDTSLATKIIEYVGYKCCYKNGHVRLEIHQNNVNLEMRVKRD
ncbi:unnamed protein product [Bursaphelenchus okinawaensis]|uniref:Uncharacterized protein n=1 Tax=Bursaphelenchus okinawaensis TaxID=465554 RepID=A0A811LS15_9BILA|nr:unnamed protein product [Bursaphelenchus okinawaensis]CAG9127766.1 unnamed protein product [Bursaphelenchus okinawaensis]